MNIPPWGREPNWRVESLLAFRLTESPKISNKRKIHTTGQRCSSTAYVGSSQRAPPSPIVLVIGKRSSLGSSYRE